MKTRGFSLIELMIVVAILGMLALIVFPAIADYNDKVVAAKIVDGKRLTENDNNRYNNRREKIDRWIDKFSETRTQVKQEPATAQAAEAQKSELLVLENQKMIMEALLPVLKALEMNKEAAEMEKAIKSTEDAIGVLKEGS